MNASVRLVAVFVLSAALLQLTDARSQQAEPVVELSCPNTDGCFRLLGPALETAPTGATIRLGPGIYYEKPLTVSKSVRILGTGSTIRIVDSGPAFTVRTAGRPVDLSFESVSIEAQLWASPPAGLPLPATQAQNMGVYVVKGPDPVQLSLDRTHIQAGYGIHIEQAPSRGISIKNSVIRAVSIAVLTQGIGENVTLTVEKSDIHVAGDPTPVGFMVLGTAKVVLRDNKVFGGFEQRGAAVQAWGLEGVVHLVLERNQSSFFENGALLLGAVQATMVDNDFSYNSGYGVTLGLTPCYPDPRFTEFTGSVQGSNNRSVGAKGSLCPPSYPWPPGFVKP